jgi:hypothetical protein
VLNAVHFEAKTEVKMKKLSRICAFLTLIALVLPLMGMTPSTASATDHHLRVRLMPVGGSGVTGFVELGQRPHDGGTFIHLFVRGLEPGQDYVSLYYDNSDCTLPGDELSAPYTASRHGFGRTHGTADDNLDEIDSVSVRKNDADLTLMACASIHENH